MGKWERIKIEELFRIKSGNFLKRKDIAEHEGFPVYGGNGITGFTRDFNLSGENIIIGRVGAKCGNVRLVKEKIWLTDNAFYISEYFGEFEKQYLKLFLGHYDLGATANQAAQPVISFKGIKNIKIPVPPLSEQKRIVAKLDGLFAKIDQAIGLLEENIVHTEALMGSVLDEEFGKLDDSNFEPFLNSVFIQNKTLTPNDGEVYKYVGLENIEANTGKLVGFSQTMGEAIKSSKVYFEKEDVLYGKLRPYLNKVWVSNFDGVSTTEIMPFKTNQDKLLPKYLAYYLRSNTFLNVVNANTSGARMPRASARFFKDIAQVPIMDLKKQGKSIARFDKLFSFFEEMKALETQKLNHLKALKSSLLDQAFKGEL